MGSGAEPTPPPPCPPPRFALLGSAISSLEATIPESQLSGKDTNSVREGSASPRDFPGRGFRSCSVETSERVTGLQGNETAQMQISKETQPEKALWTA